VGAMSKKIIIKESYILNPQSVREGYRLLVEFAANRILQGTNPTGKQSQPSDPNPSSCQPKSLINISNENRYFFSCIFSTA
jgi:hypothetical protein